MDALPETKAADHEVRGADGHRYPNIQSRGYLLVSQHRLHRRALVSQAKFLHGAAVRTILAFVVGCANGVFMYTLQKGVWSSRNNVQLFGTRQSKLFLLQLSVFI